MEKIFGYFVFGGLLLGILLGMLISSGEIPWRGIGLGAMFGAFLGWFAGAAFLEQRKKQK